MRGSIRRRGLVSALSMTLGAAGLIALTPGAAAAHYGTAIQVQSGYTDAAAPKDAFDAPSGTDLPLGAWRDEDGGEHTSRVYATFDLAAYRTKQISTGTVTLRETRVADCAKRAIELWRTDVVKKTPSWHKAPREQALLGTKNATTFCTGYLQFDVTEAVKDALTAKKPKITFEVRVPAAYENDPSYGRWLHYSIGVGFSVDYNTVPVLQEQHMYTGSDGCATAAPYPALRGGARLQALATDVDEADASSLEHDFALWPLTDPAARTELSARQHFADKIATAIVPEGTLRDGQTYGWQFRTTDSAVTTNWSRTCYFVYDESRPPAPQVNSANYPRRDEGQTPLGEPGVFTFSGGGDPDIVGFQFGWEYLGVSTCSNTGAVGQFVCADVYSLPGYVRADVAGGTATVQINPARIGPGTLKVRALDAARNTSDEVSYEIMAPWGGQPRVTVVGDGPEWNKPVTLKFTPGADIAGTVRYEYQLDNADWQSVAAVADGTATIQFVASNEWGHRLTVRSHSANGWASTTTNWQVDFGPWPGVSSAVYPLGYEPVGGVGVPGTFTFSPPPGWTEVSGYLYSFGEEHVFIAAGADGRALITWTPDVSGPAYLDVYAVRPDGTWSDYSNYHYFNVA
ncbi:hypothetical protein [Catellatospora paridis]|uniref:hypothetical protein n=1 Tax=Catellatospora paridis TaxID=1617086 RepID=UPI001E64F303|nr:hypothetical protein [Catellatospora paridis]